MFRLNKAFTLVELIVTVVVLGIIVALAIPTYNAVTSNSMISTVNGTLASMKRAGDLECLIKPGAGSNKVIEAAIDGIEGSSMDVLVVGNYVTVSLTRSGRTAVGGILFENCESDITKASIVNILPEGSNATIDTSIGNSADISGTGTFTDSSTGVVVTRSDSETQVSSNTANWEYMTVEFIKDGISLENTIFKTGGGSVVGVLTKVSNTLVIVDLPVNSAFTLTVKYNGRSSGTTYIFSG